MLTAALKVFSLVSSQQMKDSTISSARTTIAAAAIIKHNFVKLGNTKPPWHFGLASHSPHVLSMVLGSLSTVRTHKPEMRARGFQGTGCQMAQATGS